MVNNLLIDLLQQYGYPVLWGSIFVSSAGLPLPATFLLLAAGAFAALGDFNILLLFILTVSAATAGDNMGYLIGTRVGHRVLDWLTEQRRFRFVRPHVIAQGRVYFKRRGALAVFLTRFLFTALGGVTNLLAGAEYYSYRRFLLADISGQTLGALITLGLGYSFAESWEALSVLLGAVTALLLTFLLAILLLAILIHNIRRMRKAPARKRSHQ